MRCTTIPTPPREVGTTERTFQLAAKSEFPTVFFPFTALFKLPAIFSSTVQYILCLVKDFFADNWLMMIFDVVLIFLTMIFKSALGNRIESKRLSLKEITF